MKKIMLFAAACVALAACNKDIDTTTPENTTAFEKGQKVTLSVSAGNQTKVSSELNTTTGAVDFKWETGDKIKVTVGTESAEFTLKTGAGASSATFEGTMPAAGDNFNVQYPATDPDLISQTYVANALPKDKMKMAATGCTLDTPFTLTPQYAALRLNLWGSKTAGKIVVIKIDTADPSFTLDCGTGVTTGTTKADSTAFFIVVTEGSYKFSAEVFDNAETPASICKFETTNAHTFTAGQIQNMPAKEVKAALPDGALPGVFSVSATKKVRFSKGNMYCNTTTSPVTYSFEANQYDFRHYNGWTDDAAVIDGTSTTTPSGTVGSFYWSKTASVAYADTYSESGTTDSDVFFTNNNTTTPNSDFTVNGAKDVWRTLSGGKGGEWDWLLGPSESPVPGTNCRTSSTINGTANARYAAVRVNNLAGLLLFPDAFTWPSDVTTKPSTFNTFDSNWNYVNYETDDFAKLETAGCVFLPATGSRVILSIFGPPTKRVNYVNYVGDYWSSTAYSGGETHACYLHFDSDIVSPSDCNYRESGSSVRLVCDANQ